MFLDFLVFHGVLVMPGLCYDCLTNSELLASRRMCLKNKTKWQSHIQNHVDTLEDCKPVKCGLRTKQCASTFDSVLHFESYLSDAHGISALKERKTQKRSSYQDAGEQPVQRGRRQPIFHKRKRVKGERRRKTIHRCEYDFVNTTFAAMEATVGTSNASKLSSRHSLASSHSATSSSSGSRDSRTGTPLLPICDGTSIGACWSPDKTAPANDDDFVMIDALEDGSLHQLDHASSPDSTSLSLNFELPAIC